MQFSKGSANDITAAIPISKPLQSPSLETGTDVKIGMRAASLVGLTLLLGCRTSPLPLAASSSRSGSAPYGTTGKGGAGAIDGDRLAVGEGVSVWYKAQGKRSAPVVLFLHGGPGYNSYAFERAVGAQLEPRLRMIYLDQRGCGRSCPAQAEQLGIANTVDDIEKLRQHLGAEHLVLLGHSFGGLVALEYQRAHPDRVAGLILAETTGDLRTALEQQVSTLAAMAPDKFPEQATQLRGLAARVTSVWLTPVL